MLCETVRREDSEGRGREVATCEADHSSELNAAVVPEVYLISTQMCGRTLKLLAPQGSRFKRVWPVSASTLVALVSNFRLLSTLYILCDAIAMIDKHLTPIHMSNQTQKSVKS